MAPLMLAGEQQQLGGHHVAGAVLGPDCGYHNCAAAHQIRAGLVTGSLVGFGNQEKVFETNFVLWQ